MLVTYTHSREKTHVSLQNMQPNPMPPNGTIDVFRNYAQVAVGTAPHPTRQRSCSLTYNKV